jgi:hypothetical protein
MKSILLTAVLLTGLCRAQAQGNGVDYTLGMLGEYGNYTMIIGEKENIRVYTSPDQAPADVIFEKLAITINGNDLGHQDPNDGRLQVGIDGSLSYEAPYHIPAKNPVAIAVSFISPKDNKTRITLISNITIVAGYQMIVNMHVQVKEISLTCSGTAWLRLKQLEDKSYLLTPIHGGNNLDLVVDNYDIPNTRYISPKKYTTPIFITISNDKKDPQCQINFHAINNIEQTMEANGRRDTRTYQEPFLTYLNNIFLSDKSLMQSKATETMDNEQAMKAWGKRMKTYQANPNAYKNNPQAQADLAKMKSVKQQVSASNGGMMESMVHFKQSFHFNEDICFLLHQTPSPMLQSVASGDFKITISYMH